MALITLLFHYMNNIANYGVTRTRKIRGERRAIQRACNYVTLKIEQTLFIVATTDYSASCGDTLIEEQYAISMKLY